MTRDTRKIQVQQRGGFQLKKYGIKVNQEEGFDYVGSTLLTKLIRESREVEFKQKKTANSGKKFTVKTDTMIIFQKNSIRFHRFRRKERTEKSQDRSSQQRIHWRTTTANEYSMANTLDGTRSWETFWMGNFGSCKTRKPRLLRKKTNMIKKTKRCQKKWSYFGNLGNSHWLENKWSKSTKTWKYRRVRNL